jgi:hypothetical protein
MLKRLKESTFGNFVRLREAKNGPIRYPPDHKPGMAVPKGGSNCLKCRYLGPDKKTCKNKDFILWNGSKFLPLPADRYCSDWFRTKKGKTNDNPRRREH